MTPREGQVQLVEYQLRTPAEARAAAKRVIGGHDSTAIAELVEELFRSSAGARRAAS